jgi:DNA-binding XRE family transcriptional regulator
MKSFLLFHYLYKEDTMDNTEAMIKDKTVRMQLVNARKAKKLTQKEVAAESGLSESCISNIESGSDSSPTLRSLIRYASAVGIELYVGYENANKAT